MVITSTLQISHTLIKALCSFCHKVCNSVNPPSAMLNINFWLVSSFFLSSVSSFFSPSFSFFSSLTGSSFFSVFSTSQNGILCLNDETSFVMDMVGCFTSHIWFLTVREMDKIACKGRILVPWPKYGRLTYDHRR